MVESFAAHIWSIAVSVIGITGRDTLKITDTVSSHLGNWASRERVQVEEDEIRIWSEDLLTY